MQAELAARRAASENNTSPHKNLRTTESAAGHFERSGTDRRQRFAIGNHVVSFQYPKKPRQLIAMAVIFVVAIMVVAVFLGMRAESMYQTDSGTSEPTRATEQATLPAHSGSLKLSEESTLADVEEYAAECTDPIPDQDVLYGDIFDRIDTRLGHENMVASWYITDGRIYIWLECGDGADMSEVRKTGEEINESIHGIMGMEEDDAPVIIIGRNASWKLKMVMIEGSTEFISEESAP